MLCAFVASTHAIGNNDYGLHLRIGQDIVQHPQWPSKNPYSYTAPQAFYPDHEWLSQVLMYAVYSVNGDAGMVFFQAFLMSLTLYLVMQMFKKHPYRGVWHALVVWFFAFHHIEMRPHLLGWVLSVGVLLALQNARFTLVLALLVAWGNMHASVLLGAFVSAWTIHMHMKHTAPQKGWAWAAAYLIAPVCNPYGLHSYGLFFRIREHVSFVGEWKPYTANTWHFWALVAYVVFLAWGLLEQRKKPTAAWLTDAAWCIVLSSWAFTASRNLVIMAIYLSPTLALWSFPRFKILHWHRWMYLAAALLCYASSQYARVLQFRIDHTHLPVAALDFLKRHNIASPVFNDYDFGGYVLWKGFPDYPVYVDGRIEVYKGDVLNRYLHISTAQTGWEKLLEKQGIQTVLIRPERALSQALIKNPSWDLVYFDYNAVVFIRKNTSLNTRRLHNVSPYGHRNRNNIAQALEETTYLLQENPLFFGGYKIAAFLEARLGHHEKAVGLLKKHIALYPEGKKSADMQAFKSYLR